MNKVQIKCTDKQRKFLQAILEDKFYEAIAFGGARGGGKTFVSCLAMVLRRLMFPGTFGLMLRRVQKAADKNLGEEIRKVLKLLKIPVGTNGVRWLESKKEFHFPNGSIIVLGYCRQETDWEQYQGLEYTDIAFEEANQFPENAYQNISGSNRKNKVDESLHAKIWLTLNPGGIGTAWTDKRFGIKDASTADKRTLFIQSLLKESKALLEQDPGYRDRVLAKLPEWRRKQWEDGDWDALEGQFFQLDNRMFREMEVPHFAEIIAGVDAGYWPSAFAVCYYAKWVDGNGKLRVHVWKEIKKHRLNLHQQAAEAVELERIAWPTRRVKARYADPAAWKRQEDSGGLNSTTAHEWAKHGMHVTAAYSNARSAGWLLLRTLMDEKSLTIDPSCQALRLEMEGAIHSDKDDDIDSHCEDHLLDALRYGLISAVQLPSRSDSMGDYEKRRIKAKRKAKVTEIRSKA